MVNDAGGSAGVPVHQRGSITPGSGRVQSAARFVAALIVVFDAVSIAVFGAAFAALFGAVCPSWRTY